MVHLWETHRDEAQNSQKWLAENGCSGYKWFSGYWESLLQTCDLKFSLKPLFFIYILITAVSRGPRIVSNSFSCSKFHQSFNPSNGL